MEQTLLSFGKGGFKQQRGTSAGTGENAAIPQSWAGRKGTGQKLDLSLSPLLLLRPLLCCFDHTKLSICLYQCCPAQISLLFHGLLRIPVSLLLCFFTLPSSGFIAKKDFYTATKVGKTREAGIWRNSGQEKHFHLPTVPKQQQRGTSRRRFILYPGKGITVLQYSFGKMGRKGRIGKKLSSFGRKLSKRKEPLAGNKLQRKTKRAAGRTPTPIRHPTK